MNNDLQWRVYSLAPSKLCTHGKMTLNDAAAAAADDDDSNSSIRLFSQQYVRTLLLITTIKLTLQ
jgi:hypothetical protein